MCLDRAITQKQKKYFRYRKENGYSVGYKLYVKCRKKGFLLPPHFGKRHPVGEWINEKDYRQKKSITSIFYLYGSLSYPVGFHLFPRKKDAEKECREHSWKQMLIRKVYFSKASTRGIQGGKPVVVTNHIFIVQN
jgi:hypothetical protein